MPEYKNWQFARGFARLAHLGQLRKFNGEDYFEHPQRVAHQAHLRLLQAFPEATKEAKGVIMAAGYLHDVVEDCGVPLNAIRELFGPIVARVVEAVTRGEHETYKSLIVRATGDNPLSTILKLADVDDNLRDLPDGLSLGNRYREAKPLLESVLERWVYVSDGDLRNVMPEFA